MSAQPKPNEPSMEEILASIRRIIADDDVSPAAAPAPVELDIDTKALLAGAANPSEPEDDVLDLGAEAEAIAPAEQAPAQPVIAPADDLDFLEAKAPEPSVPEPDPVVPELEPQFADFIAPQPAPQPALDMAQLLSDQASNSVTSAFGQLAHTVLSNNARTLEDLVKDMLKPMLKTWLDDNLPVMVERLVRAEIERVARGGRS